MTERKLKVFIPELSRASGVAACILVDSTGDQKNQYCALYFLHPSVHSLYHPSSAVVCFFSALHRPAESARPDGRLLALLLSHLFLLMQLPRETSHPKCVDWIWVIGINVIAVRLFMFPKRQYYIQVLSVCDAPVCLVLVAFSCVCKNCNHLNTPSATVTTTNPSSLLLLRLQWFKYVFFLIKQRGIKIYFFNFLATLVKNNCFQPSVSSHITGFHRKIKATGPLCCYRAFLHLVNSLWKLPTASSINNLDTKLVPQKI